MRGLEKRQAERDAQKARDAEEWQCARARFHQVLERRGVQLNPLFVQVEATSPSSDAEWFTWWLRDEVCANTSKVQAAVAADYITEVALHAQRVAAPGESQTARMWLAAEAIGEGVLDAALMLTAIRATEKRPDFQQPQEVHQFEDKLFGRAWDTLEAASIDPYTLSSVWFLPLRLDTARSARDNDELVDAIAGNLAAFLIKWTPVRVMARYGVIEAPVQRGR